jgi:DNA repair exonuclease SbcCD nuclease subunit
MTKVALVTDTHFGARSDSIPFDNFFRRFYDETFFPEIDKRGIKTIFHLGDCFDRRKYINFNTLSSCRDYFFDAAKQRGIEIVMIVGNHDTFFKNTNNVNSPGLLLSDYDNVTAYSGPIEYSIDGTSILLMPWICTDNYNECMEAMKVSNSQVLFGHFEIAGFQMYKGHENDEGFNPKIFEKFDLVCSGHFHHRSSNGNINYLGNPYELTWADFEDPRGFHIFDTSERSLEFIQNPFSIFSKVYYDDEKVDPSTVDVSQYANQHIKLIVVNKKDYYKFDQFIERLYKVNPLELKIIEDLSEFEADAMVDQEMDLEDTVTLLSQYVDSLETDADKDRIKTLMKTLYVEAQAYEEV